MKKLLFLFLIYGISFQLSAQIPGSRGGGGQNMNMGHIYGKVLNGNTNKPLEAVSVQILQNKMDTATKTRREMVIAGQLTQANGDFSIENLPIGPPLIVRVTAVGFAPIDQKLQFVIDMNVMKSGDMSAMLNSFDKDLGNIKVTVVVKKETDVTIVGDRGTLQLGIDRKIFNVDKNIVSAGGTGVDILRNVPSVQVDLDGNVTLRNSSPQIFVDGRPTQLSLEQIPSDAIASVELITNPSAKFDASGGTSGIINIVLKKNRKVGYNGNIRTSVDSRAKIGSGADINIRQNKVNLFASLNYNQRKSISWGENDRINYYETPVTSFQQKSNNTALGAFKFFRAGVDYFADNRNTFSFATNFMGGGFKPSEIIDIYQSTIGPSNTASKSYRSSESKNRFRNGGGTISYKHLFTKPAKEITADITFNKSRNRNNSDFVSAPYNNYALLSEQQIRAYGGRQSLTIQSDYTQPVGKNGKWEAGLRYNQSKVFSVNNNYSKTPGTNYFSYLQAIGYDFESEENIYAAYSTYAQKINKTNIQLGLRMESSTYDGNLISRNQKFNNEYLFNLFPSVFLTQTLGNGQDLQINYTRKINRPNFFQLIPYIDYSDSLNISRGNPALIPEFTNSMELSYQLTYGKNGTFLVSTYYKKTDNLIARYQTKEAISGRDLILNTFINANASSVYGLELTNKNNLTAWWDLATNINFYGSKLNVPGLAVLEDKLSWFGKINSNMKLPKNFTLQISGDYQSKSILPPGGTGGGSAFGGGGGGMFGGGGGRGGGMFGGQSSSTQGYIKANWGVDLAFKKEFLKDKKASISLNVNDIFRTKVNWVHSETNLFVQDYWRRRDPQVFRLNFSYRFGKFDASLFKRKNMKGEREGMNNGMEGGM